MIKTEKNYEFRKKLIEIHKKDLRDYEIHSTSDEMEITDGYIIDISSENSDVVLTAAKDFQDYMLISMNVSVMVSLKKGTTKQYRKIPQRPFMAGTLTMQSFATLPTTVKLW